ncbi:MAG: preQ(1) synthase, partial [Thermodesulfobacteriota bacterium]
MKSAKKYGEKKIAEIKLEAWKNSDSERDYKVEISFPEFTCICPRSGYPDFACIRVEYTPDESLVELRSLKLYLNSYRDVAISHEAVTNRIFKDLAELLKPRELEVTGDFNVRGNVKTVVR